MKTAIYLLLPFMLLLTGCIYGEGDAMDSYHGSGDPLFVAIDSNSTSYLSTDGTKWTPGGDTSITPQSVTYGNGYFVTAGNNSELSKSRDGITWEKYIVSGFTGTFELILYHNNKYIACWEQTNDHKYFLLYSYNAIDWYFGSNIAGRLDNLSFGNDIYFGCGKLGPTTEISLYFSEDGRNWLSHYLDDTHLYDVAFGNTLFISVGENTSSNGSMFSSKSPPAWSENLIDDINNSLTSIEYGNKQFVSLLSNAEVLVSETGFDWDGPIDIPSAAGMTGYKIFFGNGKFIVICKQGGYGKYIFHSENGYDWSGNVAHPNMNSITDIAFRP